MKVKVSVTLDIDAEAWAQDFGIDKKDVRKDVQVYFEQTCQDQLTRIGLYELEKS